MSQLTEQTLKQLLDHDDIQARLKARSVPPVPASWKAGFLDRTLGRDAPWDDFQTAWSLLRMGRLEEGRELMRRLCKYHDTDRDNLALGAFELLRAPEDRAKSGRLLRKLSRRFAGCSEFHALYVRILGKTLTQTQHESLAGMIQIVALKGLRLTLFDLGLDALAKRVEDLLDMERHLLEDIIVAGIVHEANPAT